jgi:predicted ATP-grasp superfamily ATP-dependent carboligase
VQAIQDDNTKTQLLMQLQTILQALIVDPETGKLTEEAQPHEQQLTQIMQQVQQVLNPGGQQQQQPAG